ncbi:hypothetical protein H2199_005902 [Coniosporium tulheliwenetii]|uniref:Uncharacterized protein n=1 Tax=Coniosporium tulheliwenetii TaxID=3383036 RepID=A0ACC2YYZ3_9PEZI|nr:hypothetical protein H2199_005902 [Cladosporium sp. JES 115]
MRDSVEREQAPSPKSSASTHHDDASESIHQTYARPQEANYRGYKKRNSDIGETVDWTCEEHTLLAVALNHHDKRPYPAFDAKYIAEQFTKMFGRVITETAIESQRNRMLRPKIDDAEAPKCYRMAKQWAFNEDNVRRRWNLIIKGQPLYDNMKTRVLSSATHQGLEVYGAWGAHLFGHQPEIPAKKRGADSGRRDSLLDGGTPIKRTHSRSEATTVDERQARNVGSGWSHATQDGQNPLGKGYCHHHQATSPSHGHRTRAATAAAQTTAATHASRRVRFKSPVASSAPTRELPLPAPNPHHARPPHRANKSRPPPSPPRLRALPLSAGPGGSGTA